MGSPVWSATCLFVLILVRATAGQVFNISEPDRQTTMYGQYFMVILPLRGGAPQNGSVLQITCVSCSSSQATGTVTLSGGNASESFLANPTTSVPLSVFQPFSSNDIAVLNITSDWDVTVVVTLVMESGALSAFNAMPVASLDMYYPVASYGQQHNSLSEVTVLAVEDRTRINFKAQDQHTNSSRLSAGEWVSYVTNKSYIGNEIISNKHVVGLIETRCESVQLRCPVSHYELYPLVSMGTRYTALPVGGDNGHLKNLFRAVAVWEDTIITVTSGKHHTSTFQTFNKSLGKGQMFDFPTTILTDVQGSKPFLLLHQLEMGEPILLDTATVVVPPLQQYTHQTLTFSTYETAGLSITTYITVTSPCEHFDNIALQKISGNTSNFPRRARRSTDNLCGYNHELGPGTYQIGPRSSDPDIVYSAILYGLTDTGIYAYTLATELNQIICQVEESQVTLCPTTLPSPQSPYTPTITSTVKPTSNKRQASNKGTIIAVAISVSSFLAAGLVVSFIVYRRCKGRQWRRLDETEYMEDNPIRLQVLNRDGCFM